MKRYEDWAKRLHALIRVRRHTPYSYGFNDCFWFAHAAVMAMTGTDILPGVTPPTSRMAAAKFLINNYSGDIEELLTARLGPPLATSRLAGRGDLVTFEPFYDPFNERHIAVVDGRGAVTPGRDGLLWAPRVLWRSGWKV